MLDLEEIKKYWLTGQNVDDAYAIRDIRRLCAEVERLQERERHLDNQIDLLLCPLCDQGINAGHSPDCPNANA